MKLKIGTLAVLAAALAALWPATAGAASLKGVVVAKQRGVLLVATPSGVVRAMAGRAAVGSRIVGGRVAGRASTARVRGVVVRQVGTTLFLASNRHLLAVRTARRLASTAADPAPAPGTVVSATVSITESGGLEEEDEDEVGRHGDALQVQAVVSAVGAGTVTLSVGGQSVTVQLPAGLTLPSSIVGQTVSITVSLAHDDQDEHEDDDEHEEEDDD